MRLIYALTVTLAALTCASASNEILAILDKATDLTTQEMTVLRLILQELQKQYDHIKNEIDKTPTPYANPIDNPKITDADVDEYQAQIAALIHQEDVEEFPIQNDTKLPTIAEIVGESIDMDGLTEEQVNEVSDLLSLMQEELDETQHLIDDYMQRSKGIHANLLKINKPKIIIYIYEALGMIYGIAGRVGRAAYCTYYYGPQLNDSLTDIYDGIDCWQYTKSVVIRIETQAAEFLTNSKKTALALGDLYKRLTAKKSLLGRVLAVFLSIKKIKRSAEATYESAMKALDDIQNELPQAGTNALQCGLRFVGTLPHLQDVLQHLTACILFVEEKTEDYEFLKPEAERN